MDKTKERIDKLNRIADLIAEAATAKDIELCLQLVEREGRCPYDASNHSECTANNCQIYRGLVRIMGNGCCGIENAEYIAKQVLKRLDNKLDQLIHDLILKGDEA